MVCFCTHVLWLFLCHHLQRVVKTESLAIRAPVRMKCANARLNFPETTVSNVCIQILIQTFVTRVSEILT